jgi:short subunit dehydrogenase-like uncharacterized protein
MDDRPYDLVVFGASGFTGKFVAERVARRSRQGSLSWAVGGRNPAKLQKVLEDVSSNTGVSPSEVGIIKADVNDDSSIRQMCRSSKVLLNCVGPYRFYGEPVVKACVEEKCDYVDICGEPQFLEAMQLKYDEHARDNGVHIVGSCAFDSIPADLGLLFAKETFPGKATQVESFITISGINNGYAIHSGTWQSAVHGFAHQEELTKIRQQLFSQALPKVGPKLPKRVGKLGYYYNRKLLKYCLVFLGADPSVVRRTQYHNFQACGVDPVQYGAYFTLPSLFSILKLYLFALVFGLLARFSFGRHLLEKFPSFFSAGFFSNEGPTKESLSSVSFSMMFFTKGYPSGTSPETEKEPPLSHVTEVRGEEPAYVATSTLVVEAAITLLLEHTSLPNKGGVLTPGAAFHGTKLMDSLVSQGVQFIDHGEDYTS